MNKGRLEAFSDGVIAILITIMVLELRPPHSPEQWGELRAVFLSYILSFVFLGIYWNNHHHLLQAIKHVDGRVLWANLHLLFWLSLVPFATTMLGIEHPKEEEQKLAAAIYGGVLLGAGIAFYILSRLLVSIHGHDSTIAAALGRDFKGKASVVLYILAILFAYINPLLSYALYVVVAIMWLVPDRRIERTIVPEKAK